MNPYVEPLRLFTERLTVLHALFILFESEMAKLRKHRNAVLSANPLGAPAFLQSSRVFVFDLTAAKEDRWRMEFATPFRTAADAEYVRQLDEVVRKSRATLVAQAFEAFETFCKDSLAANLAAHPDRAASSKVKEFDDSPDSNGLAKTDPQYWRRFVRFGQTGRAGAAKILDKLRSTVGELPKGESKNIRKLDLQKWFDAMYEVRHAAVHTSAVIRFDRVSRWTDEAKLILLTYFNYQQQADGYLVDLTPEQAKRALEVFADYALLVYKAVSMADGHEWKRGLKGILQP